MKITALEITDVLGTKHAKFSPGSVTVISGGNGSGKTSILRAISRLFEGGHDPSLIRKTAKRGKVRADLDTGSAIDLTITPSGTTLEITDANGMMVPSPRKFMETLGESMAVDPGKLLSLDASTAPGKKALLAAILAAMPVSFAAEEFPAEARGLMNGQTAGLDDLAKIRKGIEETRRRIGVEVRDSDGAIKDLRRGLPDDTAGEIDWLSVSKEKRAALMAHERQLSAKLAGLRADANNEAAAVSDDYSKRDAEIRERFRLELEANALDRQKALGEASSALNAAIQEAEQDARAEHDRLTAEAATAREKASQADRVQGMRETISKLETKWRDKSDEYDRLTNILEALDKARKSKLESLPVAGLEFDGDNVLVDGVEWQNVNTARRVAVSLQLCGLRAGVLPFLILDDSEHLDAGMWEEIRAAATDGGFQMVAARVNSAGPLKIEAA